METNDVTRALIEAHGEIQDDIGKPPRIPISAATCPLKDLNGFDSMVVPVVVRMVAKRLGIPIPKDTKIENFYAEGRRKLCISEISMKVSEFLASMEVTQA